MGKFKRNKTYTLTWDEGEFEGLEVVVQSISTGHYLRLMTDLREDNHQSAMEGFADVLVSWNLVDDSDQPVPPTRAGLLAADLELVTAAIQAWQSVVGGASVPKDETSSSGSRSVEASLPMETLSESLAI